MDNIDIQNLLHSLSFAPNRERAANHWLPLIKLLHSGRIVDFFAEAAISDEWINNLSTLQTRISLCWESHKTLDAEKLNVILDGTELTLKHKMQNFEYMDECLFRIQALGWCVGFVRDQDSHLFLLNESRNLLEVLDKQSTWGRASANFIKDQGGINSTGASWIACTVLSLRPGSIWSKPIQVWGALFIDDPTTQQVLNSNIEYRKNGNGILAKLQLQLYNSQPDEIIGSVISQHPGDIKTKIGGRMITSFNDALNAAIAILNCHNNSIVIRWRLLDLENQPIQDVGGESAGGAAALGICHLLNNTVPDNRLIVLAEINKNGEFSEVDGIYQKTAAIVDAVKSNSALIDTIIVASSNNKQEAEDALKKQNMLGVIRVSVIGKI